MRSRLQRPIGLSGRNPARAVTFGPRNTARSAHPERNPPFFRVDVRVEKRWTLAERRYISLVAEVMNATLSKEQFGDEVIGPITVPSLGIEAGF